MIYVDPLTLRIQSSRWPFRYSCHLFADSLVELHNFAAILGLRKQWFQPHQKLDHYDLTVGKRKQAVRLGAVELSREQTVTRFKLQEVGL